MNSSIRLFRARLALTFAVFSVLGVLIGFVVIDYVAVAQETGPTDKETDSPTPAVDWDVDTSSRSVDDAIAALYISLESNYGSEQKLVLDAIVRAFEASRTNNGRKVYSFDEAGLIDYATKGEFINAIFYWQFESLPEYSQAWRSFFWELGCEGIDDTVEAKLADAMTALSEDAWTLAHDVDDEYGIATREAFIDATEEDLELIWAERMDVMTELYVDFIAEVKSIIDTTDYERFEWFLEGCGLEEAQ